MTRERGGRREGRVEADEWVSVSQPNAVRAPQAGRRGGAPRPEPGLCRRTGWPGLGKPGAEHHGRAHVSSPALLDDLRNARGRHGDDRQVDLPGNRTD